MTNGSVPSRRQRLTLGACIGLGVAVGLLYALLDMHLDELEQQKGPWQSFYAAHEVLDGVIPLLAGGLFGFTAFTLRQRSAAVLASRQRADELRARVQKVERDQAAWVIAAATLHEVRNPLHALGLLLDDIAHDGATGEDVNALGLRARAQMDRIANHLFALREMAPGPSPNAEPVLLAEIAGETIGEARRGAIGGDPDVRLTGARPVRVRADAAHARLILENLLRNAIEARRTLGAGAGAVVVEVSQTAAEGIVRVVDDGPGIDPEIRARLFEPLQSSKEQGLGLGLAISRALARGMGGDLTLEDGLRAGTAFVLRLPLDAP